MTEAEAQAFVLATDPNVRAAVAKLLASQDEPKTAWAARSWGERAALLRAHGDGAGARAVRDATEKAHAQTVAARRAAQEKRRVREVTNHIIAGFEGRGGAQGDGADGDAHAAGAGATPRLAV